VTDVRTLVAKMSPRIFLLPEAQALGQGQIPDRFWFDGLRREPDHGSGVAIEAATIAGEHESCSPSRLVFHAIRHRQPPSKTGAKGPLRQAAAGRGWRVVFNALRLLITPSSPWRHRTEGSLANACKEWRGRSVHGWRAYQTEGVPGPRRQDQAVVTAAFEFSSV